jgi:hypothetical protein
MEIEERVVAVVADVRVVGPAPEPCRIEADADILINLP